MHGIKMCNESYSAKCNGTDDDEPTVTLSNVHTIAVITLLTITTAVTIGGNAITFVAVVTNRRLRRSAFFFLLSLCVADFMIGLLVIPLSLIAHVTYELEGKWTLGVGLCDLFTFANLFFGISSVFNLCAISWDRYVSVTSPFKYALRMGRNKAIKIITVCWIGAALLAVLFAYFIKISEKRQMCGIKDVDLVCSITMTVVCYLIPFTFLIYVNGRILSIAHSHLQAINCQIKTANISSPSQLNNNETRVKQIAGGRIQSERRTAKLFVIVTGAFLLCYTPFVLSFVLDGAIGISGFVLYVTIVLTYLNSACNPFLYSVFSKEIRSAVGGLLPCRRKRKILDVQNSKSFKLHQRCTTDF